VLCACLQVPPGGTNFQFRDPTEARHAVWQALTSSDNPKPLNKSHYALAIGSQAYCMGGAGIYTAPTMAGPWSYEGSLYNQMIPEPQVRPHACPVCGMIAALVQGELAGMQMAAEEGPICLHYGTC
jgi:hypothetical protein